VVREKIEKATRLIDSSSTSPNSVISVTVKPTILLEYKLFHPPNWTLESRMHANVHVRFGGGPTEKAR